MIRALLTRRGLTAVGLVLVLGFACYLLGRWQWSRYDEKQVRASAVAANYTADPVPLASVLPQSDTALREDQAWSHVTVTGRYAVSRQLLVRGRPLQGSPGMEVVVPLDVGGRLLLVDRGWVANADDAQTLPQVPAAPGGDVTVTGWLMPSEASRGHDLPSGQLASLSTDDARAQLGGVVYPAYLVLGDEHTASGAAAPRPTPLEAPTGDLGPHQAYALQWWATALLGVAFLVFLVRNNPQQFGRSAPAPSGPARPAKPKKVRIWDEEDG
ncbi:MAG: SURF1 family protein [Dermatophilaceae bacterium]